MSCLFPPCARPGKPCLPMAYDRNAGVRTRRNGASLHRREAGEIIFLYNLLPWLTSRHLKGILTPAQEEHMRASTKNPRAPDFSKKTEQKSIKKLRCTLIDKNIHHHVSGGYPSVSPASLRPSGCCVRFGNQSKCQYRFGGSGSSPSAVWIY